MGSSRRIGEGRLSEYPKLKPSDSDSDFDGLRLNFSFRLS
jgi:hypothetical protein